MQCESTQSFPEPPTLQYPQIRGIAQPIRHLFYYLGTKFNQQKIQNIRELEAGFNSGYPKLIQGQFEITDTVAIFRHLSRFYDRPDLLGLTPQNRAIINEFLFHYSDLRSKIIKKISQGAKLAYGKAQGEVYQIKVNIAKCIVQDECKSIKQLLQMYMKNKGWILGYLTIADFFFYELCFYVVHFLGSCLKNSLMYRNFQGFMALFESQDFYKDNKQLITSKKIFMPFKDKQTGDIMTSFWEGDKQLIA